MSFALASIAMEERDLPESHRRLIECFTVAAEVGFAELTAYALGVAADVALAVDAAEDAAVLLEASRESFRRIGGTPQVHDAERHARLAASLADRLERRGRGVRPRSSASRRGAVALALGLDTARA